MNWLVWTGRKQADRRFAVRQGARLLLAAVVVCAASIASLTHARAAEREVLAFYYGWWGNPQTSGRWVHWKGVDETARAIANTAHFPVLGAYDSHDPAIVERQMEMAHGAGITALVASWWGRGSFENRGMRLLLDAAARHGLKISAYLEKIEGADAAARSKAATAGLEYLLAQYGHHAAWLRSAGQPVVFVYGRALNALSPAAWSQVEAQLRRDTPRGVVLIADSLKASFAHVFDGTSAYNVTSQTARRRPPEIRAWAHQNYPKIVAAAGPGKISTVTVIPGYDDRKLRRPPPRPTTDRWGGETYRALWQEAIAARPDWVLITSWNEWHEGTEIEPSVEHGRRALDDTALYSREFLARRR